MKGRVAAASYCRCMHVCTVGPVGMIQYIWDGNLCLRAEGPGGACFRGFWGGGGGWSGVDLAASPPLSE